MTSEYKLKLKPQESFFVLFSDETAEDRTDAELDQMMQEFRQVAGNHGYDVSSWGNWKSALRFFGQAAIDQLDESWRGSDTK